MEDMRSIRHCRRKHCTKLCGVAEDEELIEWRAGVQVVKFAGDCPRMVSSSCLESSGRATDHSLLDPAVTVCIIALLSNLLGLDASKWIVANT